MSAPLRIEYLPLADLKPYDRNARTHSADQVAQIATSIQTFGWTNPVLIDEGSNIIAGHGRLAAATVLGLAEVPTIRLEGLDDQQRRALALADNKLALNAGWDEKLLVGELQGLGDLQGLVGFSADELLRLLGGHEGLTDPDEAPPVPAEPVTRPGDLWLLGPHRLLCGDAMKDAEELTGRQVSCIIADPPYGMRLDTDFSGIKGSLKSMGRKHGTRGNRYDQVIGDHEDFDPGPVISQFAAVAEQFWFGADYYAERIPDRINGSWLVWDKRKETQADAIGSEFELCWSRQKHKRRILRHDWFGFLSSENGSDARNRVHPTQKPVTLLADIMKQWTKANDVVLDPFVGSGSTIIAAEMTDRTCYALEISPAYVDVAVTRWENFTGKKAERQPAQAYVAA